MPRCLRCEQFIFAHPDALRQRPEIFGPCERGGGLHVFDVCILPRSCRAGPDEILPGAPARVRDHQKHGLLTELSGDPGGDALGAVEERPAPEARGAHEHLRHVPVLPTPLPGAARLHVGHVREGRSDETLDGGSERARVEGGREASVARRSAGDPGSDVDADGARRRCVSSGAGGGSARQAKKLAGTASHSRRLPRRELEACDGRAAGRAWIHLVARGDAVTVETSWLSADEDVRKALGSRGFRRRKDGSYFLEIDKHDEIGIARAVTKAAVVLLSEDPEFGGGPRT